MPAGGRQRRGPAQPTLPWSLRFMLVASLLVPLLFLGVTAWQRHGQMMAAAEADAERLSAVAHEHALKVIETNALVLDRLEDRIRGLSWDEVAARGEELHDWMRALDAQIAQIVALHIVRPDGDTVLLSLAWPTPPLNLSTRGYFRAMVGGETGLVLGEPFRSPITGQTSVVVGRALRTADGRFGGAVLGALLASYFEAQWRMMDPDGRAAFALIRADGVPLVAHPTPAQTLAAPDPAAIQGAAIIERLGERGECLVALRRIGQFPLSVSVTLDLDRVRAAWRRNVAALAAICGLAAAALVFATVLAIRRWRSEQAVQVALRAEICRREEAEASLMQSQRLEALGRLTGGVAHDFNNLLTAILGTVTLLEKHLGGVADDRARRLLGMARDAVRRGATLNQSLLAFARRQTLTPTSLDANALVQGFVPLVQRALGDAVTLDLALGQDLPQCRADAGQLESAILNLAINARDAMPRGGTVRIETRQAELDQAVLAGNPDACPGPHVAIAVRDTGTGMPPEVRERAFEPFFTTKPMGQGTGLGLSQVFGFVRQLGGHVAIDSSPGSGTTVTLYLPTAGPAEARAAPPAAMLPDTVPAVARATVLVVEDDSRILEVVSETLREAGFRVLAAADGPQALALLERGEAVDALFSDVVMPGGMTGIELAQRAGALRPGMPVLLATGYAGPGSGTQAHGFEVLAKPYDMAALVRRLAELTALPQRGVA